MPRPSPSAARVVMLLNFLAEHPSEFFSLSELARRLDMNKATAHGLLGVLADAGYLFRHPTDKTFALGPAVVALGQAAIAGDAKLVAFAHSEMEALSQSTGAQCTVSTVVGDEVVVVGVSGNTNPATFSAGTRARLYPPIGLVFLAWAPEARVREWLDSVASTAADKDRYRALLASVRKRGFSISANAEIRARLNEAMRDAHEAAFTPKIEATLRALAADLAREEEELLELRATRKYSVHSISAPVFDAKGDVRISLLLREFPELTGKKVLEYAAELTAACDRVTKMIGGAPPPVRDLAVLRS